MEPRPLLAPGPTSRYGTATQKWNQFEPWAVRAHLRADHRALAQRPEGGFGADLIISRFVPANLRESVPGHHTTSPRSSFQTTLPPRPAASLARVSWSLADGGTQMEAISRTTEDPPKTER